MQYGTKTVDQTGKTIKVEGVDFNFSKKASDKVIEGVPRLDDKVVEVQNKKI